MVGQGSGYGWGWWWWWLMMVEEEKEKEEGKGEGRVGSDDDVREDHSLDGYWRLSIARHEPKHCTHFT